MKVNFNSIDLKTIKHKHCENCFFNRISNYHFCATLPLVICLRDSQIYVPIENLSDVFRL